MPIPKINQSSVWVFYFTGSSKTLEYYLMDESENQGIYFSEQIGQCNGQDIYYATFIIRITMTEEEITKAISKALQIYNMPNITSFDDYTPEELENMTYIYINLNLQVWIPGYEKEILQEEAEAYHIGSLRIGTTQYPLYVF